MMYVIALSLPQGAYSSYGTLRLSILASWYL